ncbi:hypothetical protein [Amycolatopsis thermoflava]|uniref:hypothetical protein n=1 Tax=Amycolatopsis thermoflava TaxID=84480 RepID=UPI00381A9797
MTAPDQPGLWPKRTVRCDLRSLDEHAVTGAIEFRQSGSPWCIVDDVLVVPATITAAAVGGVVEVALACTDFGEVPPAGFAWTAQVTINGLTRPAFPFQLPTAVEPFDLLTAVPPAEGAVVRKVAGRGPDSAGNVVLEPGDIAGLTDALVDIDSRLDSLEADQVVVVTGSTGGNSALASLLAALEQRGLITNDTTE